MTKFRVFTEMIIRCLIVWLMILLMLVTYDMTWAHRDAVVARYSACDQLADHSLTRAETLATTRWCGEQGVLFTFDTAPRRIRAAVREGR